jgi:DNA-binding response OmpR family regulator
MADYLPSEAQELEGPELEIKSILLLDDDIELADTLKRLLEARNFVVTAVKNGVEGLREVMAFDFDVIICDLMMPAMPGDMFYLAVKKAKPHLAERFIFVTGHSDRPEVSEFLENNRGLALFKPVNEADLIRTVSLVLQSTAPSRS